MDPMRKVGFVMVIPGAVMLIVIFLPLFIDVFLPRGNNLPWTFTWASVLGMFFFFSGLALVWVTGGLKGEKNKRNK